jgi:3-(3-hydroxy-phenyl)propionate hydroxylase
MVLLGHNKLKRDYASFCDIRMATRVNWIEQHPEGATVYVEDPISVSGIAASFVVGADGASSSVRKLLGIPYAGFTFDERFLVASTEFRFEDVFDNLAHVNYVADPDEWCVILKTDKNWRCLFPTDPKMKPAEILDPAFAQARLQHLYKRDVPFDVIHAGMYAVHQRVASKYYKGRALLIGDACHIHNPLGGMGLNGGTHDAWCVGQKLVRILKEGSDYGAEFEDYDQHRRLISQDFIQKHTIANKKLMESTDPKVQKQRQADLMRQANDPALAKEFLMERAMLTILRKGFNVKDQRELLAMPLLDAPLLRTSKANCPNGHSLVSCTRKGAWYCDRCRKNMPPGTESMYCSRCDYDWCGTCSHQGELTSTVPFYH